MQPDEVTSELEALRFATLLACRRLRASSRRVLLEHCLCVLDKAITVAHHDPHLYRSLYGCRKAVRDALNSKPTSRLAFTRSLRDQSLKVCREAGLWRREGQ